MNARIRLAPTVALLVLGVLSSSVPGCHADSVKCSWFLRPSIFPNVPPTLRFKYVRLLARTSPARTYKDAFLPAKAWDSQFKCLIPADSSCPHCALFKRSLPAWSTGQKVAPFGRRDSRRIVFPTLLENGFEVMRTPHFLGRDNDTPWYGTWSNDIVRRGFLTAVYQKHNRLPHLARIDNKARLERQARRLYRLFPNYERLQTLILPDEAKAFLAEWKSRKNLRQSQNQVWVLKPVLGSTSHGVRVVTDLQQVRPQLKPNPDAEPIYRQHVIQEYVPNPYLIRGRKAELRMYVVATSTMPLRVYMSTPAAAVVKNGLRPFTRDPALLNDKCVHTIPRHGCGNHGTHTRVDRLTEQDLSKAQLDAVYSRIEEILAGLLLLLQKEAWILSEHILLNRYSGYHPMTFDFFLDQTKQDGNLTVYFNEMNNMRAIHSEVEAGHVPIEVMNLAGYHLPPLSSSQAKLLQQCQPALNLSSATFDERLYKLELSEKEHRKQERVIGALLAALQNARDKTFDFEGQLDQIMADIIQPDGLTPDDVRYLIRHFNEEARTVPYFRQLLPLPPPATGQRQTRPQEWRDMYSRMMYYAKVLLLDRKPGPLASAPVPIDGATSALYYYTLYEAYTRQHGQDLKMLKELAGAGYHLQ